MSLKLILRVAILLVCSFSVLTCKEDEFTPNDDVSQIISDAYIYAYPLITMKITNDVVTNVPQPYGPLGLAPVNQFVHCHRIPDPTYKSIVSPNVDTFYSDAWLDLKQEPMVISVPDATLYAPAGSDWRYYQIEMSDAWTNVFASPGERTNSTDAHNFLITGPDWSGTVPAGMIQCASPTNMVWVNGRTMIKNHADSATVVSFQNAITIMPLSAWPGPYVAPNGVVDNSIDMQTTPAEQVMALPVQKFFQILCDMLPNNPPASYDSEMINNLAKVGITPGGVFELSGFSESQQKAINDGYADGQFRLGNLSNTVVQENSNGWKYFLEGIGAYGNNYEARAYIAVVGFGANLPDDAVYPKVDVDNSNHQLNNSNKYTITFPAGQTPPYNGFWSITMYNDQHLLVANSINRYALGSCYDLQLNPDNSLTLYIQKDNPGAEKESNWLPTSMVNNENFNLIMRIYWPGESVLNGQWKVPAVVKEN